jgi:predicted site-specific integrase-resolvase
MNAKTEKYYNAKALSKKLRVHYKTVLYWWRTGKLKGAYRSDISREILIPERLANDLFKKYGERIEK